jgi:thiol-disulfide isomerase/thioredoxin
VLASSVELENAGSAAYQTEHMAKLFEEGFSFSGFERDKLFLSDEGKRFVDVSGLSGLDSVTDGRGAAYGDFDNDGDYDVLRTGLQGQVHHLFRNNIGQDKGYLRVELRGTTSGRDAFGAEVRLKTTRGVQTKVKTGGSGYVSQSDPRLLFGLGPDDGAEWLAVSWPSGLEERFGRVAAGSSVLLVEGTGRIEPVDETAFSLPDPAAADAAVLAGLSVGPGDRFPSVALVDADGERTDFGAWRQPDARYLVNLWATWCVPCRREMPELEKLSPGLEAAGVRVVGISVDIGPARQRVPGFVEQMGVTYPVFTTDENGLDAIYRTGRAVVPVSLIVGQDGMVEQVLSGWSEATAAAMEDLVNGGSQPATPPPR